MLETTMDAQFFHSDFQALGLTIIIFQS